MTTGTWTPESAPLEFPDHAISSALNYSHADGFPANTPDEVRDLLPWMTRSQAEWQPHLEKQIDEHLFRLAYFFTLAEQHWPEWTAGDKNPAIWVCKVLKQRQLFPDKALTVWFREHSDNRFIPYGNALG